ncbi:glycosyltransferase family 2 protein [Allochromatium tepidum]|uniref:Glycosyltransferase 2-like domain-containing protein n=1 Tax=Allochromatium tepidum TaxID=553982 RepID=A0ABM7QJC9_9GAMM|nr:glycosyltransferase family 2 protein [Allochromatium tepidum]BCU05880.1 hypothetical protein Atep_05570 [Allochromatium tepidum]
MNDLVAVIMPTRNRSRLLKRSVLSLLRQTHQKLEILVFDDGSTDDTAEVLADLAKKDPRVRFFHSDVSVGIATALNRLINQCRGRFIVRMDDDDVAYPERIQKQLSFMQANRLGVCGTGCRRVAGWRRSRIIYPQTHELIRAELLFQPPLLHPSVMMVRSLLLQHGGYRTDVPHAEDYELWVRLIEHTRFGNVPEVLLDYTLSAQQVSRRYNAAQVESAKRIRAQYLSQFPVSYDSREAAIHVSLREPIPIKDLTALEEAGRWLLKLSGWFTEDCRTVFARQWFLCAVRAAGLGPPAFEVWNSMPLASDISPQRRRMLWGLCQLRLRYRSAPYRWLEPLAGSGG